MFWKVRLRPRRARRSRSGSGLGIFEFKVVKLPFFTVFCTLFSSLYNKPLIPQRYAELVLLADIFLLFLSWTRMGPGI
jgi:hypothetical protein